MDWIKERHGDQNVLSAVIHRDERGKLNARSFVGNKKALSDLQSDFAEKVSEQYGLRRGIKGSVARHERVQRVYGLH
ncbi:plasmid recombination protein [uncultured Roseobacter sp.]|uniref:plasmid recombination protein n=1 Tax=uncultured Roseobacter sp. TaxID=114847 RepID=UPI00344D092E